MHGKAIPWTGKGSPPRRFQTVCSPGCSPAASCCFTTPPSTRPRRSPESSKPCRRTAIRLCPSLSSSSPATAPSTAPAVRSRHKIDSLSVSGSGIFDLKAFAHFRVRMKKTGSSGTYQGHDLLHNIQNREKIKHICVDLPLGLLYYPIRRSGEEERFRVPIRSSLRYAVLEINII